MESRESIFTAPLTGTPMTGLTVYEATAPGSAAAIPAMAMKTSEPLLFTSSSTLPGVLCADATAISNWMPNLFSIAMAFSATGRSLLLPMIMDTLDIAGNYCITDINFSGRNQKKKGKRFRERPGSALENGDQEYSDGNESTDEDTDEVDDGIVQRFVQFDSAEGRYIAPSDEPSPYDKDDETDYSPGDADSETGI